MTSRQSLLQPLSGNNVDFTDCDHRFMTEAISLAAEAERLGEVPVGAILVANDEIIGRGYNQPILTNDPTAHAEVIALREAGRTLGNYRLPGTTLYVTLQPCSMCQGALRHARVNRIVFGAFDEKPAMPITQQEGGLLQEACAMQLKQFYKQKRC